MRIRRPLTFILFDLLVKVYGFRWSMCNCTHDENYERDASLMP